MNLSPSSGPSGTQVQVTGSGYFYDTGEIQVRWENETGPLLATVDNNNGSFSAQITIPQASAGAHFVVACTYFQSETECNDESVNSRHGRATFTIPASATPGVTAPPTTAPSQRPTSSPITSTAPSTSPSGSPGPSIDLPTNVKEGIYGPSTDLFLRRDRAVIPNAGVVPRCAPQEQSTILDFDDLIEGEEAAEAYASRGVHMRGYFRSPSTGQNETRALTVSRPVPGTISQPFAITTGSDREKPSLEITFDQPQRYVGIHLGSPGSLVTGGTSVVASLSAYGPPTDERFPTGRYLGADSALIRQRSPVDTCLLFMSDLPAITRIQVSLASSGSTFEYPFGILGADRLFFSAAHTYQTPELVSGTLSISRPYQGARFDAAAPITVAGSIEPGVSNRRPDLVTVRWLRWDRAAFMSAVASLSSNYSGSWFTLEGVTIPPGESVISATATGPGFIARDSVTVVGTGAPAPPPDEVARRSGYDVVPFGLEVTQGVRGKLGGVLKASKTTRPPPRPGQSGSGAPAGATRVSSPPRKVTDGAVHVARRTTVVRGYAHLTYPQPPDRPSAFPVPAQLHGTKNGATLPGSPLMPVNGSVNVGPLGDATQHSKLQALREHADGGWNFVLPMEWTNAGDISLRLDVNPSGDPGRVAEDEGGTSNSLGADRVTFATIARRDLHLVLVDYYWRDRVDGPQRNAAPTHDQLIGALDYWWRTYPLPDDGLPVYSITNVRAAPGDRVPRNWPALRLVDSAPSPPIPGVPTWNYATMFESAPVSPRVHEGFVGLITNPGTAMGCMGAAALNTTDFWSAACDRPIAQEPGHALGLTHLSNRHNEANGGSYYDRFAGDHAELGKDVVGFDVLALQPIPASSEDSVRRTTTHTHDLMSYGRDPGWVSIKTWNDLAQKLQSHNRGNPATPQVFAGSTEYDPPIPTPSPTASPRALGSDDADFRLAGGQVDDVLLFSGSVGRDGAISPAFLASDTKTAYRRQFEGDQYKLVLTDASGVVATKDFKTVLLTHGAEGGLFVVAHEQQQGSVSKAQILEGDREIATIEAGPARPRVSIIEPSSGDAWGPEGEVEVSWRASDADRDRLTYRVEVGGNGDPWKVVAGPTTQRSAKLDLASLPVDGDVRIRVQASDGLNVGSAVVDRLRVEPRGPRPMIVRPADGSFVPPQRVVNFVGSAVDGKGIVLPDEALRWFLDGDEIGRGRTASFGGLLEGEYEVVLRASQANRPDGEAKMTLVVSADRDRDQLPDSWERDHGLSDSDAGDSQLDGDHDDLANWREFAKGADPRELDTDGDRYADGVEVEAGSDPADSDSIPIALHSGGSSPPAPGAASGRGLAVVVLAGDRGPGPRSGRRRGHPPPTPPEDRSRRGSGPSRDALTSQKAHG